MAKFVSHLYGAAAVSGVASIWVYSQDWVETGQAQLLFLLGVAGGLLPDIDSDSSTTSKIFFSVLGVAAAFLVSFSLVERIHLHDLAVIWGAVFLLVRYAAFVVFARFTVHRGIWHSWLGLTLAALAGANVSFHLAGWSPFHAWLAGSFIALGYLTHLCLDEIASVDLLGNRVRRSFGTALKLFSRSSPQPALAMVTAVIALFVAAPPIEPLVEEHRSHDRSDRVLPAQTPIVDDWFSGFSALFE